MAAPEELEPLHCACGALVLRVNEEGIELHCRRCNRRRVVPYGALQNKERLVQFMTASQTREQRP